MKPPRAGLMRQMLAFQRATLTSDGQGGNATTWTTLACVPGQLIPVSGREAEQAARLVATVTHSWMAQYSAILATVTPKDRIVWNGQVFEIGLVMNVENLNRLVTGLATLVAA